ncbi:hypothetical protein GKJPGBOP_04432 [Streptomyces paromomycinus]|uniref:Uncharacterized protein n=2 Tax=Streptomyces paromomycinus TaxID=92743 RepID=A0A401W603_STREY|nr:hypothetical protein GKJPGBOP_04432 [Streptomyces paromomycinus]
MPNDQQRKLILIPVFILAPLIALLVIVNLTATGVAKISLMVVLIAALMVCVGFIAAGIARSRHE